ncbi:MAG TPA: sigma-70 family RNA polymerase sigma factor [Spirochaetia bacterium]|nr:sigma-70 family RNA polymerase sigma factor [Spirochaetia bacterium]
MSVNAEEFYRKYGPMVLRRCRQLLRNEEEALDAMQDVFVKVLRKESVLEDRAPSSLLYTIATNTCLNILRSSHRRPVSSEDVAELEVAGSDDPELKAVTSHMLETIFAGEQASTRTMAVLHYVDRFTLEETAEQVGLSVSGVRKRLRKLAKKGAMLKEC